jgi:hypothetical protein
MTWYPSWKDDSNDFEALSSICVFSVLPAGPGREVGVFSRDTEQQLTSFV